MRSTLVSVVSNSKQHQSLIGFWSLIDSLLFRHWRSNFYLYSVNDFLNNYIYSSTYSIFFVVSFGIVHRIGSPIRFAKHILAGALIPLERLKQIMRKSSAAQCASISGVSQQKKRCIDYIVAWPDSIYDCTKAKSRFSLLIKEIAYSYRHTHISLIYFMKMKCSLLRRAKAREHV